MTVDVRYNISLRDGKHGTHKSSLPVGAFMVIHLQIKLIKQKNNYYCSHIVSFQ